MADESAVSERAAPNAEGEQRAAWTAAEWRAHEVAVRAAADNKDCSSKALVGLVVEVTLSLFAGLPRDDNDARIAAADCVNAVIDGLYSRPPGGAQLRAAVTTALYAFTSAEGWYTSLTVHDAVTGALVHVLDQFSLDESALARRAVSALDFCFRALIEGAADGEPPRVMTGKRATAAAAALARASARHVTGPAASILVLLLKEACDDKVAARRAALDAAPSLPRVLLSELTSFGEAPGDNGAPNAAHASALLVVLAAEPEVAALLRAEPGAATGEAVSLRAAVHALRAMATDAPMTSLGAVSAAEVLVIMFANALRERYSLSPLLHRAYVASGVLEFQVELFISRGSLDAKLFSHLLITLDAIIVCNESDAIARKVATQPAVDAAFAGLRAHAAAMDALTLRRLTSYLYEAATRFGRRPNVPGKSPAVLASAFVPPLRAHLNDATTSMEVISSMLVVSNVGKTPCGSVALMRRCVPVLLEALRRHATAPDVAAYTALTLSQVVTASVGARSPLVPSELGDLRAVVASLATALRTVVEAATRLPSDDDLLTAQDRALMVTKPMRALADAVVPFQEEVARDHAILAALAAVLRLQPVARELAENVTASLRSVLRIDRSGSRAQKRAVMALLRSTRLGAAFCAAAEATDHTEPHCELVMSLVAFFTRHGLHVDSSRSATPRAARACDACGIIETQQQLAALSPGSTKHRLCGRCLGVSYCSVACQRAAWPAHKATCRAATEE